MRPGVSQGVRNSETRAVVGEVVVGRVLGDQGD